MRIRVPGMGAVLLSLAMVAGVSLGALIGATGSARLSVLAASPQHSTGRAAGAASFATAVGTATALASAGAAKTGTTTVMATATSATSARTATALTSQTPPPQITGTAVSTATPGSMTTASATATAVSTGALQVRVAPRTIRGGRTTTCRIRSTPPTPSGVAPTGCVIISVTTSPRTILLYTLTYPDAPGVRQALGTPSLRDTFKDITDPRGYSAHAFYVPYVPTMATVVRVTVTAKRADGATVPSATTQFTVTP